MALGAIPLFPPIEAYPPLPYRGEDVRPVIRSEPFACGSTVTQLIAETPFDAVSRHNHTHEHILWREINGI